VYINIDRYGNTSAASIPICLDELLEAKTIGPGKPIILVAFGAGVTWASCVWNM
jgi:3-oxoacyl-[acyl-carrier-protein] synthase-3